MKALELLERSTDLRDRLENTRFSARAWPETGFRRSCRASIRSYPIMLGDAALAPGWPTRMLEKGVYVIGFLPGGAAGQGPHPHPGLRGPHARIWISRRCCTIRGW
jgi:glycine C-acetyltransferase